MLVPTVVTAAVFLATPACDGQTPPASKAPQDPGAQSTRAVVEDTGQSIAKRCRAQSAGAVACGLDVPEELCREFPGTDAQVVECIHGGCLKRFGWTRATSVRTYGDRRESCAKSGDPTQCDVDRVIRPEAAACIFDAVGFSRRSSPDLRLVPGDAYWCSRIRRTELEAGGHVDRVCASATGAPVVTTPVVATRVDQLPK